MNRLTFARQYLQPSCGIPIKHQGSDIHIWQILPSNRTIFFSFILLWSERPPYQHYSITAQRKLKQTDYIFDKINDIIVETILKYLSFLKKNVKARQTLAVHGICVLRKPEVVVNDSPEVHVLCYNLCGFSINNPCCNV